MISTIGVSIVHIFTYISDFLSFMKQFTYRFALESGYLIIISFEKT